MNGLLLIDDGLVDLESKIARLQTEGVPAFQGATVVRLVGGSLAAIFGLIDFLSIGRAREHLDGWIHFLGNAAFLVLALGSLILRRPDPAAAVLPWGLLLSAIIVSILAVTDWFGGELAYRHMIGMTGHNETEKQRHAHHED